jgi:hypothetical protein
MFHIFKSSFEILKSFMKEDQLDFDLGFGEWVELREKTNFKVNQFILRKVKKISYSDEYADLEINKIGESYYWLVRFHLNRRISIAKMLYRYKVFYESAFIVMSYVDLLIVLLMKLMRNYISSAMGGYVFKNQSSAKYDICLCFPSHSFNRSDALLHNAGRVVPASFAEYWCAYEEGEKILSINEYNRPSMSGAEVGIGFNELTRNKISRERLNFTSLLLNLLLVPLVFGKSFLKNRSVLCSLYLAVIYLKQHALLCFLLKKNNDIDRIYRLPFSDDLHIRNHKVLSKKVITFSYSFNFTEFPSHFSDINAVDGPLDALEILSNFSIGIWCYYGNSIGYTAVFEKINNLKKLLINTYKDDGELHTETPCMLGFENATEIAFGHRGLGILVFDVPPQTLESQLSLHFSGDYFARLDFLHMWLSAVVSIAIDSGAFIYFKPKYSISNYDTAYANLISYFEEKYDEKFIVLDPYASIKSIITVCPLSISLPYTSSQRFVECIGLKSYYYLPDDYERFYHGMDISYIRNVIIGKDALSSIVCEYFNKLGEGQK